jgi:hypothetical protein
MKSGVLRFVFVGAMTALSPGGAIAQVQTAILDCKYEESNHQQRTASGGGMVDWMPPHEVIYRVCDGCTINSEAAQEPGASAGIDRSGGALPVWKVTDNEYSYGYSSNEYYGGVKINRYSGAATNELHVLHDTFQQYIAGDGYYFLSNGACKKVDKPAL